MSIGPSKILRAGYEAFRPDGVWHEQCPFKSALAHAYWREGWSKAQREHEARIEMERCAEAVKEAAVDEFVRLHNIAKERGLI